MTDLLTKVKAALDLHKIDHMDSDDWAKIGPDMARALIAAGELADVCDELMGLFPDQRLHLEKALATFRAAMEGRVDG
jgi:hypothetical protein